MKFKKTLNVGVESVEYLTELILGTGNREHENSRGRLI